MFDSEPCKGFDKKRVISTLIDAGVLTPANDGKPATLISVSRVKMKLYRLNAEKLFSTD
jgi:hypothetical protein